MKRHLLILGLLAFGASLVLAAAPSWWASEPTRILSADSSDNYAPANLGQLKLVAKKAMEYLDLYLPGGAGPDIAQMVASFEPRQGQGYTPQQISQFKAANYAPANLGQLKAVAKPFYDRLLSVGYDTRQNLISHGYPNDWSFDYPWSPATPVAENYAPANLGQIKMTFSFDITTDSDGDGLPDLWEQYYFGGLGSEPDEDGDGDGLTNAEELAAGLNPSAADTDGDGLSDSEEIAEGTNPKKSDTDSDGVLDGQDGWPLEPLLKTPRLPVTRYAVIVRATGNDKTPSALGSSGDVVYTQAAAGPNSSSTLHYIALNATSSLPILNTNWPGMATPSESLGVIGIADDHTVFGTWYRSDTANPAEWHWNFRWTPGPDSIVYTNDRFTLPPPFVKKNVSEANSAGSAFYGSYVSGAGVVYGTGVCSRFDYDTARAVDVWSPGKNNTAISDYAPNAYQGAMHFLNLPDDPPVSGSLSWPGRLTLVNNQGDMIYHYDGLQVFPDALPEPSPAAGDYFTPRLPISLASNSYVALNDQKHLLADSGIHALASATPTWQPVGTPRLTHPGALPLAVWQAFNSRLEAIGTRSLLPPLSYSEPVVLINDHDYRLHDLIPPDWRILSLTAINDEGIILARAVQTIDGSGNPIPPSAQVSCVVLLLPIEIFPDDGMVNVVGDVVPSIKGPRGKKHFVSPQLNATIPNPHVVLKKKGISDSFFLQYCQWGSGGQAVTGQPLKRQVSRAAPDMEEVTVELASTGQTLARMSVWVVWADKEAVNKPVPIFTGGDQGDYFTNAFATFKFTIKPALMIDDVAALGAAGVRDVPDLTGVRDLRYLVPDGQHWLDRRPSGVPRRWREGVTLKWDVSRQMKISVYNEALGIPPPGSSHDAWTRVLEPFPGGPDSLGGNDDSYPHGFDEDDIPYAVNAPPGNLSHAVGEVTSGDRPKPVTPSAILAEVRRNGVPLADGTPFEQKFEFREFVRLQIGRKWYRVSGNVEWFRELKAKWQAGTPEGTWVNDGSNYGPH